MTKNLVGSTIGQRFSILEKIAEGGMSTIYKAQDEDLGEVVVLKVLRAELADEIEMISRFKREIKLARKIKHPNICGIYNFWHMEGIYFISMEYIEGQELTKFVIQDRSDFAQIVSFIPGIVLALSAAHRHNIIHRDLKPSNIMINDQSRPIIMDFGIARHGGQSNLTRREVILGTPRYMSPEQLKGEELDIRSDIYSLGVILYELFTGKSPFQAETIYEIAQKHISDEPSRPRKHNESIPLQLENIILKCLSKSPKDRYQKADDILIDLHLGHTQIAQKSDRKKILVVDDDDNFVEMMRKFLEQFDFITLRATNGEEAITSALQNSPDLICLDLLMPDMDGYHATEFLRFNEETQHIPIIVLTNVRDKAYEVYSRTIGIDAYFTKPLNLQIVIDTIQKILNTPA